MKKYTYNIRIQQEKNHLSYITVNRNKQTIISSSILKEIVENYFAFSKSNGEIIDFSVIKECEYSYSFNEYFDDELYTDLLWFNKAIDLISSDNPTHEQFIQLFEDYNTNESHQNDDSYFSKSIDNIVAETHYFSSLSEFVEYGNILISEFLNVLNINSIIYFDIIQKMFGKIKEGVYVTEFLFERRFTYDEDDFKRTFFYLENIVLKIKTILNYLYSYIIDNCFMNRLAPMTLENIFKEFKRELIIREEIHQLYNKSINIDLYETESQRYRILELISPYKKRGKAKQLLSELDIHYRISDNQKIKKRKLGAIIRILHISDYFDKNISFERFKKYICEYYGHDNISIKPNKIIHEAQIEYQQTSLFKDYSIDIQSILQ